MPASLTAPKILTLDSGVLTGTKKAPVNIIRVLVGFTGTAGADVIVDANDVYQILSVPAGTVVLGVYSRIITAFTATLTLDIGDGDDPNGWLATAKVAPQTADTAGVYKDPKLPTAEAYAGGKKYLVADTIDIDFGTTAPLAGVIEILVAIADATSGTT